MPKFKWVGEPPRSFVETYGPTTEFRIRKKNGTTRVCVPDNPVTGFAIGEVFKDEAREEINFQDPTSIRFLEHDSRTEEVVV
jgi:hypothetical protein